ncbi:Putative Rab-GTPase-TBC domain-containing protein [Septoria linicola]|uniref:Rab-GTPase-TBC domain-containing protein n=1 Tax=Septoria linicola TaxID=215465 RepID=A0A9Q9AY70_9PEZI|nr:Putative Rab-GTPase-TBC domain-containing protein [Septoria linicola]
MNSNKDLSRHSTRQPLVAADETSSYTSFPDPAESASPSLQGVSINEQGEGIQASNLEQHDSSHDAANLFPAAGQEHATRDRALSEPLSELLDGGGHPSMFDTQEIDIGNPQNLAAANKEAIERVVQHRGAVELVRHLSKLLAERDAHVTALTRLAEEYKVPQDRIADTADRVKQAERRRLSLARAANEELLMKRNASVSSKATSGSIAEGPLPETNGNATIRGLTKFFGGNGKATIKKKQSAAATSLKSGSSSRSSSAQPSTVKATKAARPKSIDVQSLNSVASGDSMGWATTLFGGMSAAGGTIKNLGAGSGNRRGSEREPREPVEMSTRHDEGTLPPTLSKNLLSQPAKSQHETEWNRYLTRLQRSREQAGEEARSGELIGASRFGNEGSSGKQKQEMLTRLVLGGIPMRFRHAIWMELLNTQAIMQPDGYKYYLELENEDSDSSEVDAILKDVPRTLTSKYDYYAEKGYDRLRRLLVAFVSKYPGLGYTQGLNMIAGYLLLAIPDESDAFWVLCDMVDNFFPKNYFSKETAMSAPIADNIVLRSYIKEQLPKLAAKMDQLEVAPEHTVPLSWFLTAFTSVLPESVLLRIWDVWLCIPGQQTFLFNIALTLLAVHQKGLVECEDQSDWWAYMSSRIKVSEEPDKVNELIRSAFLMRKKLEHVEQRRTLEVKRNLKKTPSTEALYSPDAEAGGSSR